MIDTVQGEIDAQKALVLEQTVQRNTEAMEQLEQQEELLRQQSESVLGAADRLAAALMGAEALRREEEEEEVHVVMVNDFTYIKCSRFWSHCS